MSRHDYPSQESAVDVIFIDGEVKTFTITASNGIAHHLMSEAAKTGVLVMRDDRVKRSICIPLAQVRHIEIQTIDPNAVTE
jgi:hypothetical protein